MVGNRDGGVAVLEHLHPPSKMRWIWSLQIAEASGLPSGLYAEPWSWPIKKPLSSRWQVKAESELRVISTCLTHVNQMQVKSPSKSIETSNNASLA